MKFPIGIQTLEQIIEDGYVYVDKTALVYKMVSEGKVYFLSRPRRFGKSLLTSTLKAYFQGRRELFKGLAIEKLEAEWREYPIFHIDFSNLNFSKPGVLENALEDFVANTEAEYGRGKQASDLGKRFETVLESAKQKTGRGCVVLVDEYDKPLLDVMGTVQEEVNRDILKGFYSTFKAADEHTKFVFLTGVTKFAQVSVFSGFNQPRDISMDPRYEALCGITEEELYRYFPEQIKALAEAEGSSEAEIKKRLRSHYDGYHFSRRMTGVYNPFSILNALDSGELRDFWFSTGTPTYLIRLMESWNENMDELLATAYTEAEFVDYRATTERPLPMLYQSGYLTIKSYDPEDSSYELGFPNKEVRLGFLTMLATSYFKADGSVGPWLRRLSKAMRQGEPEEMRKLLTSFFAGVPYSLRRRGSGERALERDFQYAFFLIMRILGDYLVVAEKQTSEGRVDCVVETAKFVYIFEFKRDGTAKEALEQIEAKGYAREYEADARTLYKIGCNFSTETGTIDDWVCVAR